MIRTFQLSASQWDTVGSSSPLSSPFAIRWPRTSHSTRRSPADCASARSTSPERSRARRREPARLAGAALRRRARRREAEPHPERERARRGKVDAADSRLPRRAGRWSRRSSFFRSGGHVAHAELRRRKAEAQAAQPLARGISQSAVWDAVHERAMDLRVASPTGASSDLYRARAGDLRALEDAFPRNLASAVRSSDRGRHVSRHGLAARCLRAPLAEAPGGLLAGRARPARWEADGGHRDRRLRRRRRPLVGVEAAVGRARRGDLRLRSDRVIGSGSCSATRRSSSPRSAATTAADAPSAGSLARARAVNRHHGSR